MTREGKKKVLVREARNEKMGERKGIYIYAEKTHNTTIEGVLGEGGVY